MMSWYVSWLKSCFWCCFMMSFLVSWCHVLFHDDIPCLMMSCLVSWWQLFVSWCHVLSHDDNSCSMMSCFGSWGFHDVIPCLWCHPISQTCPMSFPYSIDYPFWSMDQCFTIVPCAVISPNIMFDLCVWAPIQVMMIFDKSLLHIDNIVTNDCK